jgi:3-hydroxyacyl-CoA dehydrogenase
VIQMDDLNALAAKAAIGKMIADGYFSISAVDKAMKLLGCPRGGIVAWLRR